MIAAAVALMFGLQLKLLPLEDEEHNHFPVLQQPTHKIAELRRMENPSKTALVVLQDSKSSSTLPLWNTSFSLPAWMDDYMEWHKHMRQTALKPELWKNSSTRPKLLILQCMDSNPKCGGAADRLKPLPLVLLGAYQTKRLLFIRWRNRPYPLEEFMIPPPGSLDWRVPVWLDEALQDNYQGLSRRHIQNVKPFLEILTKQSFQTLDVVTATMQWWDGGEQAYKNALGDNSSDEFRRIYHDLFRTLFQPTPPVQALLTHIWQTTPLRPNQYAVAH
jgi:hypothetical protein